MINTLKIDEELKSYIPKLTEDEYSLLESSILADGCRDPIVVWGGWVLDGHNRYEICQKHNKPFQTVEKVGLKTKDDVKVWMIKNQIGRRNLTDFQRTELALRLKPFIENQAKEKQATSTGGENPQLRPNSDEAAKPVRTDNEIAKIAGVGKDTVRKVEKIIQQAEPETIEKARSGEMSINAAANTIGAGKPPKQEEDTPEQLRPNSDEAGEEGFSDSNFTDQPDDQSDDELADCMPDQQEIIDTLQAQIAELEAKIEALSKTDQAAELSEQIKKRFAMEKQVQHHLNRASQLEKELRYQGRLLADIRKLLELESNTQILSSIKKLKGQ